MQRFINVCSFNRDWTRTPYRKYTHFTLHFVIVTDGYQSKAYYEFT